jgi:hypothetical protein
MAHWAEIDENNIVVRVIVTSNDDLNEGYDWILENLGGTWVKTSYNTSNGVHYLPDSIRDADGNRVSSGEPHLRFNFANIGHVYDEQLDAFYAVKPDREIKNEGQENEKIWDYVLDEDKCVWNRVQIK